jgi:hypothetical protein
LWDCEFKINQNCCKNEHFVQLTISLYLPQTISNKHILQTFCDCRFVSIHTLGEVVADFSHQPSHATLDCRTVAEGTYTLTEECAEGYFTDPVLIE